MKRKEKRARPGQFQWLKDCITLAVNTGMRRGELVNLRWEDVCFETEMITVRNRDGFTTKGGDERRIPFTPESRSLLLRLREEWPDALPTDPVLRSYTGGQVSADYLSRRFKHYVRLAKLDERFTFHSLRHTTASWLVQKGVSLPVVQAILGHSNISVTERYAHLAPDVMRAAMEQAFARR